MVHETPLRRECGRAEEMWRWRMTERARRLTDRQRRLIRLVWARKTLREIVAETGWDRRNVWASLQSLGIEARKGKPGPKREERQV